MRVIALYAFFVCTYVVRHEHHGRTAHVTRHPVYDIGSAAKEVRRIPRQGYSRLVHKVDSQVLRRCRRFCTRIDMQEKTTYYRYYIRTHYYIHI